MLICAKPYESSPVEALPLWAWLLPPDSAITIAYIVSAPWPRNPAWWISDIKSPPPPAGWWAPLLGLLPPCPAGLPGSPSPWLLMTYWLMSCCPPGGCRESDAWSWATYDNHWLRDIRRSYGDDGRSPHGLIHLPLPVFAKIGRASW